MADAPAAIGLLALDTHFAKPPGHIRNIASLPFPVVRAVVRGTTISELLDRPSDTFFAPFLDAARDLERRGCAAITGSCGFMALYQRELAAAVSVPVFSSSLIQIPLMHQMAGARGRVGVITAKKAALTADHLRAVGAEATPVAIAGMEDQPEFSQVVLAGKRRQLDEDKVAAELVAVARHLVAGHGDISSIVLECTDLPPYAHALQAATGLPVADLTTLAGMVHAIVTRRRYSGATRYD